MSNMFEECGNLTEMDLSSFNMNSVTETYDMMRTCRALTKLYTPVNCRTYVGLPCEMQRSDGSLITELPRDLSESELIVRSGPIPVSDVSINTTEETLGPGNTFQLEAEIKPRNATDKTVTWTSSDPTVATVDSTGLVTAVGMGYAIITVTTVDGGYTKICEITVGDSVTGVRISTTEETLVSGDTFQIEAWALPETAANRRLKWSGSDEMVASVSGTGLVTARETGSATITVTTVDGGYTAACAIIVSVPVTGVTLDQSRVTVTEGESFWLTASVVPENATNQNLIWESSDSEVASVDSSGLVSASVPGTAVITVTTEDGGKVAFCIVTVKKEYIPVAGVSLDQTKKTITEGKSFRLTAAIQPENATDRNVVWESTDPNVAVVDENGLVNAVTPGSAVITVTTEEGGKVAFCVVTVEEEYIPVTGVAMDQVRVTVTEGESFRLTALVAPENATNKNVRWVSADPGNAVVDSLGNVSAVRAGKTVITATTEDGGRVAFCIVTVESKVIPVTGVTMDRTRVTVTEGENFTLSASVAPENATNKKARWVSSDPGIAAVDSAGHVSSVTPGTALMTATTEDGGKVAFCIVTVKAKIYPVTGVTLDQSEKLIDAKESFTLTASVAPENATNRRVIWSTSNPAVAAVDSYGVVTGIASGSAVITVTTEDGGKTASCTVTVQVPVTGIKISTAARTIEPGKTFQLAAWPQPSNATNKAVTWTSSNSAVATVSSKGLVKAVKAGSATITVKTADGGKTATCKITVK